MILKAVEQLRRSITAAELFVGLGVFLVGIVLLWFIDAIVAGVLEAFRQDKKDGGSHE